MQILKEHLQREMEKEKSARKAHVVVVPFPTQGHINPMLQFSKRLASKGLKVTLATTLYITETIHPDPGGEVLIEAFSDGCEEYGIPNTGNVSIYLEQFRVVGSKNLYRLIRGHSSSKYPVTCLVYDSIVTWCLDLAKQLGLVSASFFTQSCVVGAIYHHVQHGLLSLPVQRPTVSIPGLPLLRKEELPSFITEFEAYPVLFHLLSSQFSNIDDVDWILFNTFNKLEEEVVNWMEKQWPMRMITIGPTVPSMYLDNPLKGDDTYGLNLLEPDSTTCMKWLDTKGTNSVVYVSFGSVASLGENQMEEMAWGLEKSKSNFLWVVRAAEEQKLPKGVKEEMSEKGLVVTWCPQLEVLAHPSVGCFVTHCGWNSTLEALSLGVPMVAMPQSTDQFTNAKLVEDVWGVGIRVKKDEKGIVRREEVEKCIWDVMEGEKSEDIKNNAVKWKDLAKDAVDKGGSSVNNIDKFVAKLIST